MASWTKLGTNVSTVDKSTNLARLLGGIIVIVQSHYGLEIKYIKIHILQSAWHIVNAQ